MRRYRYTKYVGFRCDECRGLKAMRQKGTSGMCLQCESVLADDVLFHLYGAGVQTMDCPDCRSTYVARPGITAQIELGLMRFFCPWCELDTKAADMEAR